MGLALAELADIQKAALQTRAVLCDIDGTLLDSHHRLAQATIDAIRRAVKAGLTFAIATGRMPSGTDHIVQELGITCWRICYSGALVLDPERNTVFSRTIDLDQTCEVLAFIKRLWPSLAVNYFAGVSWYVEDVTNTAVQEEARIVQALPEQASFEELIDKHILPNKLFISRSIDKGSSLKIADALVHRFPGLGVIRSSNGVMIEIVPPHVDKALGTLELLKHLDIDPQDAIAFGDDVNDIPMLEAVGIGVAMGNAPAQVKKAADYTALSNDDNGVAITINTIM